MIYKIYTKVNYYNFSCKMKKLNKIINTSLYTKTAILPYRYK